MKSSSKSFGSFLKGLELILEAEGADTDYCCSDDGYCFFAGSVKTKEMFDIAMDLLGWKWDPDGNSYYWIF